MNAKRQRGKRVVEDIVLPMMARACPVGREPEFFAGLAKMGLTERAYLEPIIRGLKERQELEGGDPA